MIDASGLHDGSGDVAVHGVVAAPAAQTGPSAFGVVVQEAEQEPGDSDREDAGEQSHRDAQEVPEEEKGVGRFPGRLRR
ncbi:hypothetical protein [Nocardiopsis lambiniae]|uniref:Uncharacterized protein n=1 Tax=Nocardiopsis lambiniae TaxID=3075539 RepID=A0ABU2MA12_9ACTN|nr:hypothetical protein [Nocardiopsis sp. DSM 44743]MDT0329425.1 hypothetical protein [Nocardiopsis sp. DSM 44743]